MRVGEAGALEVGHRVGLAPDDIVEDPEPFILQHRSDAENIVVASDHPERTIGLQDAVCLGHPGFAERIIDRVAIELVPIIVDRVDAATLGAKQIAAELKVIGRIGKDHIDAGIGKRAHRIDAIPLDDPVHRQRQRRCIRFPNLYQNPHIVLLNSHERPA
jgi:hypothetical protein